MQSELKPCPFCGGEAYIDDDTMGHSVVCCKNIECRAQGPFRSTDDEAIAAWNARASDAEITRLTEALRAAEEREKGLREALEPFAFLEMEKDEGLADTQYVWETIYRERVQDWFSYEDISAARAALKGPSHD